jgi:hypothetical protein
MIVRSQEKPHFYRSDSSIIKMLLLLWALV